MADRRRSALLLVDFMNPFDFDGADRLALRAIRAARSTARLKHRARAQRIPCIYANDNFGNWTSEFSALTAQLAGKGGASAQIVEILRPHKGDLSILKPRHSAFYGTPLEFLLDDLEVGRLVIAGVAADICVFATAQDAHIRKLEVWVPADCVAAGNAEYERLALAQMARTMKADVRAASRVETLW